MDFDEYDYLEKTVENPEAQKTKETANGGDETRKSGEKDHSRSSKHKREEKDDGEHQSKRSKSGDDSRDRDRHKERNSSRHRSQSRDGERDKIRSSREHRDREDKDRSREERHGRGRDRERREPERESVQGREKGRERERERERSRRSSSRSERHRGDQDDGERSRDRELKEREREKELREREIESRRHKDKKEEAKEPEADPERDQRTVFAYQISLKADERDVYEFFSRAGKVRDVRLIMDRISKRSKGVGYIEFYDVMSVPMAIALSGQPLLSQPVMVKPSEAEKNLVQSTTATAATGIGPYSGGARRLYVGNLHSNIKEEDLRQVFGAFGPVELVQLPPDETGNCKGFGFVQFARLEDARNALSLNGQLEIGGRTIKVSAVTDQTGMQELGANAADFDDDEGGSLSLNARSRALLMQKLDRSGSATSITSPVGTPVVNSNGLSLPTAPNLGAPTVVSSLAPVTSLPALAGFGGAGLQVPSVTAPSIDTIGVPSECLLLKNMFDPALESEPNFDLDIKDDVQDECSKFGNLKHIYVDKNSAGLVYLRFENAQSAVAAQRALHGRWFAGKMITATYMVPLTYEAKFPDSR